MNKLFVSIVMCGLVGAGASLPRNIMAALPSAAKKQPEVQEAISAAARQHKVDPLILHVISDKESAGGDTRSLYRFEPDLYSRLRNEKSHRGLSDSEVRMLASSHGVFHILGLTAERECGLHFSKLYDVDLSARCAAKIVGRIDSSLKGKPAPVRLKEIFRQYNGQGPKADMYATDAMTRLAAVLYDKRKG